MAQPRFHVSTVTVELSDESENLESIAMMNYAEAICVLCFEYLAIFARLHVFLLRVYKSVLQSRKINNRILSFTDKSCLFLVK